VKDMDKKIMVVDDNPEVLSSIKTLFEREGYKVK